MNEILQTIAILIAALLWGGVVVVDFVVTPARFRTPNVEREAMLAIGQQIFRLFGYVQVGLGVLLLIVVIVAGGDEKVIVPAVFLLALAALNSSLLEPLMASVRKSTKDNEEIRSRRYRQLHQAYMASDIFKVILGVILIAALVAA